MLERGAVEEVERLMERRLKPDLPVMRAIGVREIAAWQEGEISREEMLTRGQIATRQYAKRQYTWFSHQPPPDWPRHRSEEHTSELQSLMRISYAVFCLKKNKTNKTLTIN